MISHQALHSAAKCWERKGGRDPSSLSLFSWEIRPDRKFFTLKPSDGATYSEAKVVQVLPFKKMKETCNFHLSYKLTMRDKMIQKNPEDHIVWILKRFFVNYGGKWCNNRSIWSITNKISGSNGNLFCKNILCHPLVPYINGTCLNLLCI